MPAASVPRSDTQSQAESCEFVNPSLFAFRVDTTTHSMSASPKVGIGLLRVLIEWNVRSPLQVSVCGCDVQARSLMTLGTLWSSEETVSCEAFTLRRVGRFVRSLLTSQTLTDRLDFVYVQI